MFATVYLLIFFGLSVGGYLGQSKIQPNFEVMANKTIQPPPEPPPDDKGKPIIEPD